MTTSSTKRTPAVYLPHGGGPWPWIESQQADYAEATTYLRGLSSALDAPPTAILCISAHWEESAPTVLSSPAPPMLYDYSGFPPETYEVDWPAPGDTALAADIASMLADAGFEAASDPERGFDHGAFVPLALAFPAADVPTLQLSLVAGLDPATHIRLGRALAPLRERGVFIVGSGMSYHNMRAFMEHRHGGPAPLADSQAFDEWLAESVTSPREQREAALIEWEAAPSARASHPREEHLIPLHVIAGAAEDDEATLPYRGVMLGAMVSAVHFG